MDFQTNKFDERTCNKMINEYQYTIQVHIDDLKLSHVQQDELNTIIDQLNGVFGPNDNMLKASYGKIHEYLGMIIDWSTEGKVVFTMYDYLEDILSEAPADFDGEDVTPAVSNLFSVNLTQQKLDETTTDLFHLIVASFSLYGQDSTT